MLDSVLILDGTAFAYRAFYAVRRLSTRDGHPTNALFGFIRMVRQLADRWQPSRIVATFDGGSPAHRLEKCPAYKAQRSPMPDDLRAQLPLINEYLDAAGIPRILIQGQEADDVMATLADRAARQGALVRLATSDKDLMQLVSSRIHIIPPTKTDDELDPNGVEARTGVRPEQIVDWLALIGDTADNIPGVHGVGPKTATQLLARFGSLAACFDRAQEIESPSLRTKLLAGRDVAALNIALMTLDRQVPDVPDWSNISPPHPDPLRLRAFFEKYELHPFSPHPPPRPPRTDPQKDSGQLSLF